MSKFSRSRLLMFAAATLAVALLAPMVYADHSWGNYHWARTANPFTLKLADNLTSNWDPFLGVASNDWSASTVLNTTVVAGTVNPKTCKPLTGQVDVCNAK